MSAALYHQAIVDAARAAVGAGQLSPCDAEATVDNPLCGDRVTMQLRLRGGRIDALAHRVRGCLLCEAAASVIGELAPGRAPAELQAMSATVRALLAGAAPGGARDAARLEMFSPVGAFKSRHECVLLPFAALERAIDDRGDGT